MRYVYFGLPLGAAMLTAAGFPPDAAVIWHLDAPGMRRLRRGLACRGTLLLGRPDLEDPAVLGALASLRPDAILSWFFPRRIPRTILELARVGAFGVHPSLLPRWRGPDPYFWAIREGDASTGVTLHRLESEYDTGAILDTREVPIGPDEDSWSLARKLDRPSLALLVTCAERIARGDPMEGTPQDASAAILAPAPTDEDLSLRFDRSVEELLRWIRAAAPAPGVCATLGGTDAVILRAERAPFALPRALKPGEAFVDERGVCVAAADGAIQLLTVEVGEAIVEGAAIASLFRK